MSRRVKGVDHTGATWRFPRPTRLVTDRGRPTDPPYGPAEPHFHRDSSKMTEDWRLTGSSRPMRPPNRGSAGGVGGVHQWPPGLYLGLTSSSALTRLWQTCGLQPLTVKFYPKLMDLHWWTNRPASRDDSEFPQIEDGRSAQMPNTFESDLGSLKKRKNNRSVSKYKPDNFSSSVPNLLRFFS